MRITRRFGTILAFSFLAGAALFGISACESRTAGIDGTQVNRDVFQAQVEAERQRITASAKADADAAVAEAAAKADQAKRNLKDRENSYKLAAAKLTSDTQIQAQQLSIDYERDAGSLTALIDRIGESADRTIAGVNALAAEKLNALSTTRSKGLADLDQKDRAWDAASGVLNSGVLSSIPGVGAFAGVAGLLLGHMRGQSVGKRDANAERDRADAAWDAALADAKAKALALQHADTHNTVLQAGLAALRLVPAPAPDVPAADTTSDTKAAA